MKRYLPLLIILAVALVAAGAGAWLYQVKMKAQPAPVAGLEKAPPVENSETNSVHTQGPANAPVTLEMYGDFQCPPCATAATGVSELEKEFGPQLRVIFREFPLAMHHHALAAALAAEAAGLQGKFWGMHDLLYKYQDVWSKAADTSRVFDAYAASLGLDRGRFKADSRSLDLKMRIRTEGELGVARGVTSTPTMFINGEMMKGIFDRDHLHSSIAAALAAKKKK